MGDQQDTGAAGSSEDGTDASAEPGFGEVAGADALPDMTDTLPSLETGTGAQSTEPQSPGQGSPEGDSTMAGNTSGAPQNPGAQGAGSGTEPGGYPPSSTPSTVPGTRAEGGLEGIDGVDGTLTTAEQVAILDRQLEQSTSDFDTMILEEQQRQRELERERSSRQADREQPESAGPGTGGRSPYQDDVAMGGGGAGGGIGGSSSAGGGIGRSSNPAIYKAPEDIPEGTDDDVVARQLREAAMREPDPEVRKKLWDEYRKYKGLEIPEE